MINYATAFKLINIWADYLNIPIEVNFEDKKNFRLDISGAEFEYQETNGYIIIRAIVSRFSNDLKNRQDVLEELKYQNKIISEEVLGSYFEFDETAIEIDYEARLNIRIDLKSEFMGDDEFIKLIKDIISLASKWNFVLFGELLDKLNEKLH